MHPRFHTPVLNLLLTGAVGFVALTLTVSTSTSFINFGAFTAFAFVNISVVAQYLRDRENTDRNPLSWVLQPLIGLAVVVWLLLHLDAHALVLGGTWVLLGVAMLLYLTRGLRTPPPEMRFDESEADVGAA